MALSARIADKFLADPSKYEDDLECEFDELEVPDHIRQARMDELTKIRENLEMMQRNEHGSYKECTSTAEFLKMTTVPGSRVVCHFYHPDMKRCKIVDKHLQLLSKKHYKTKFVKFNATECGFLVTKLQLKVLPAIFCFVDADVTERIIGFDRLKGEDNFKTIELEMLLFESGVLGGKEDKTYASAFVSKAVKQHDSDDGF
eukprot:CFRG2678T1